MFKGHVYAYKLDEDKLVCVLKVNETSVFEQNGKVALNKDGNISFSIYSLRDFHFYMYTLD